MRWKNIKTILILLLLGVNGWLAWLLGVRYTAQTYYDRAVLEDAVEILARDQIFLTAEQLDSRRRDADVYGAEIGDDYYEQVAGMFTDSPIADLFPTPTGMRMLSAAGENIVVDSSFAVSYAGAGLDRELLAEKAAQAARTGEPLSLSLFSLRELRSTLEALLTKTASPGGTVAAAHARLCVDEAYRLGEETLVRCHQEIDGRAVRGHQVDCLFDRHGSLIYLSGKWSFLSLSANYSAQLYDQINILFMEKAAVGERRERGEALQLTIAQMTLRYVLCAGRGEGNGSQVYYSPAWVIEYTDGSERIYNAVTGTAVSETEA